MTDEVVRKSALFFFLLTLDDDISQRATERALKALRLKLKMQAGASTESDSELEAAIHCCLSEWQKMKTTLPVDQRQLITTKALLWPDHVDLNPWKDFKKKCSENELVAVVVVHILGLSESALARCMKVKEGTIRYRVAHGLALLGQLNRPGLSALQFS